MRSSARCLRVLLSFASLSFASACALEPEPEPSMGTRGLVGLPIDNANATRSYLATLRFIGPPKRSRVNCHSGPPVDIDIYPEQSSHQVSPIDASNRGRIVAMIKNVDHSTCADLHLAPGDSAYWWMGPNRGVAVTTDFWSIPPQGPIHHLAETGEVNWHRDGQRPSPNALISEHLVHPAGDDDGDAPVHFGHNSTWIACLGGCCESTTLVENFY